MTPNLSHVAGLELAKKAMEQQRERYGGVHKASLACLDGLIEIANSAPAEVVSLEAVEYQQLSRWGCWDRIEKDVFDLGVLGHTPERFRALHTAPPSPDAELVELLRSKFPRIDPCKPIPLNEKAHCCEYTIYVERERLHRMIDAKMASLKGEP